ncbi:hypothetical protein BDZ85DRAFT_278756 [Elsinoe ampelina]|uniref:Uncharacterized protein n=1 Tax=Elsinoe ampelina TaxID=302913 RepID=A0A6A6GMJ4_9PEZI|nr:hypothetical protein BDZ85DRAFT_278756 [Elsinoe ampelina]
MPKYVLLKNGTLLVHDDSDHVTPTTSDLLVTGNKMFRIALSVDPPEECEVVETAPASSLVPALSTANSTLSAEHKLGRIREVYLATLVVFDGMSPQMLGAAQEDPVRAIVVHSSPGDVEMVVVDGKVTK